MAESNVTTCAKKSQLTEGVSLRQTIQRLRLDIQDPLPSEAEAAQKFLEGLNFVETAYNGIPAFIAEYEEAYPNFKHSGSTFNTAECQWREIEKWNGPIDAVKEAITALRDQYYRDETEAPPNNSHPNKKLDDAVQAFRLIKNCLDQRTEEEEEVVAAYNKTKDFKKTVEGWFADLTALHEQAKGYYDKKKSKSLHAVYLEAGQVWYKIENAIKTPQGLKDDLTNALWSVLKAKHERYMWHKHWLKKQQAVTEAQAIYNTFKENRRKDFFREAEDVPEPAGNPGNGGPGNGGPGHGEPGNGYGKAPDPYVSTTPVT